MNERRIWVGASRIVAVLVACACFSLAMSVQRAFAADDFKTYQASNGWELAYSVSDEGTATIEDVTAAGSGTLTVPAQIDGHDVVAFAKESFYNKGGNDFTAQLAEIEIPDTVTTFGTSAFMGAGLTKVSIPASVEAIPASCFAACSKLAEVVFEGDSMLNIGESAFSGCSSLTRLDIPELTKNLNHESFRVGRKSFYRCTNLESVVFHGSVNTFKPQPRENSTTPKGDYLAEIDCFGYCENLKNIVYYCKRATMKSGTGTATTANGATLYQTLAFYSSAEDSANCVNPVYTITCKNTVKALDVLNGTVSPDDIWEEWGERPALSSDMTWGIQWGNEDNSRIYANTKLSDTYNVIPVKKSDFAFGWVSSDFLDNYRDTTPETGSMGSNNYPSFYIDDAKNVSELKNLVVYAPGGVLADPSTYTLHYQKAESIQLDRSSITEYSDVSVPTETGGYRVRAEGTSGAGTSTYTAWMLFDVVTFSPTVTAYPNEDHAVRLGRASQAVSSKIAGTAICDVVVPASDWRYQLIGSGLAGVGNGVLLYDDGANYSSRTVTAFAESRASSLQVVGSASIIPESASPSAETYLMDFLNERGLQNKTRYSKDSTVQELADQVYSTIRRLQNSGNTVYGEGWGKTAIVASPSCCIDTLPIAQYAYAEKAPVFFTREDGTLSSTDLGYLKNDGFEKVVIAGDTGYVSNACASTIQSQCGIVPTRMFDAGSNSLEACLGSIADVKHGDATVVIAATNNPGNTTAGAIIAAAHGGTMLPCSSTSDSKRIQDYLRAIIAKDGQSSVSTIYLLGDFSNIDPDLRSRISKMWTDPESTAVGVGDSFEIGDYVYALKAGNKAQCVLVRNPDIVDVVVQGFSYEGSSYTTELPAPSAFSSMDSVASITIKDPTITTVPAWAFSDIPVKTVDLGSGVSAIDGSAFENCATLSQVSAPATTAIGSRAFAGCTALGSVSLDAATSVGASAFAGCTALASASLPKCSSVGASAFQGCSGLSSVSLMGATSVGTSAFQDCTALKSVSLPSATAIGTSAFAGCSALTSASLPKVAAISAFAFQNCTALASMDVSGATSIGASAFQGCAAVKSFSSSKVTTLGDSAFAGCTGLKSFTASKVKTIGASALEGCTKLAKASFKSAKLKKIGAKAFYGCKKLKKLTLKTKKLTKKRIGAKAFTGMPKKAKVYVPKSKVKKYKKYFVKKGLSKKAKVVKG